MSEYEQNSIKKQIWAIEDLIKTLKLSLDQAETALKSLKKLGGDLDEK